jgi:predicted nicotinamide N-methyase
MLGDVTDGEVLDDLFGPDDTGTDGLRLHAAPLVPEVRLHLAEDSVLLWARLEAQLGTELAPPFWATAWPGGLAVARHVLDHAELVARRHVLDLATGSGLVAVAAALAGAAEVVANDVDPFALAVARRNARANGVRVTTSGADLLDGDGGDADVVLAGDVFYTRAMAERVCAFLDRAVRRGADVLVGDPGRPFLPRDRLEVVASYELSGVSAPEDAQLHRVQVLRPRPS